jgi:hypothetical protein
MDRRKRFGLAGISLAASVLGIGALAQVQPTPGSPGFPGMGSPMFIPSTPEQIKKQTANRVLREMVTLKLSVGDLAAARPLLRDLLDLETAYHGQVEAALDQEKAALLAAGPNDSSVPDGTEKTQQMMRAYQDKQDKTWEAVSKAIGADKGNGLRSLAGQGGYAPTSFPVGPAGSPGGSPGGLQLRPEGPDGRPTPIPNGTSVPLPQRNRTPGVMPGMAFLMRPHVTLAELVDLVDQKLAAMKK